ncbi:hypothetical protein GCM10010178_49950 [Lentzea flava]|uniref:Uncharacterized protein n=1 Tax=Lentzea flava TaxID=103732 RepID=A0ABQ2US88_9PSEU|nr:hypothetical protein GCM10010178_49950 [Lentzea flava]
MRLQISRDGQESRSLRREGRPSVDGMCFMFGASREQVCHVLGLDDEELPREEVLVPAAEDRPRD